MTRWQVFGLVLGTIAGATAAVCGCGKTRDGAARGPAPAWRATVDKDAFDGIAVGPSTLVMVGKAGVTALRDGKAVWTRTLPAEPGGWLVALGTDAVLAGDDSGTVHALAMADGAITWSAVTPLFDSDDADHPWVKAAAAAGGGRVVLLDSYSRFLIVDTAACAKHPDGCITQSGQLKSGAEADHLVVMADGTRVVTSFEHAALYSPAGERIAGFHAADLVMGAAIAGDAVIVAHDQGVARLHPARCAVDVDTVIQLADSDSAPPGCMDTVHAGPVDGSPIAAADQVAWVNEQEVFGRAGKRTWQIPMERVHVGSALVNAGATGYVACWQEPEGSDIFVTQPDLCTIDLASGAVVRRSRLGIRAQGLLHDPWIVVSDRMVFVVLGDQLAAVPVAPA